MKTANQLYKESKTTLPFKEWLNEQKTNGILKESTNQEQVMYQNVTEEKKPMVEILGIDVKHIIIATIIIGAAWAGYRYLKKRQ